MDEFAFMRDRAKSAAVISTRPPTEIVRGPNLSNTIPEIGLMRMPAAAAGSMTMPVSSADAPMAVWSKMGSRVLVTRHAALMSVTTMAATAKSLDFRQRKSSSGSSSVRWRLTNAIRHTMPTIIVPSTAMLVQPSVEALENP